MEICEKEIYREFLKYQYLLTVVQENFISIGIALCFFYTGTGNTITWKEVAVNF